MKRAITQDRLLPGADRVVRRMLPLVLESRGLPLSAASLRGLPVLRDVGSVTFAVAAMSRAASEAGPAEAAVRLCGEAAMAAVVGDARKFVSLVKTAAASLRRMTPRASLPN